MTERAGKSFFVDSRALKAFSGLCAGVFALLGLVMPLTAAHADDMTFSLVSVGNSAQCGRRCPVVIEAEGEIGDQTPAQFLEFVQENVGQGNLHAVVFLDSPGGKVAASMELGRAFRRIGAAVVIAPRRS